MSTTTTSRSKKATAAVRAAPQASNVLHVHAPHPHTVQNANVVHGWTRARGGFNARLATRITKGTGTMQCAYVFAAIGLGSLIGILIGNSLLAGVLGSLSSYFLQLVLLPIISVGQEQMSSHQEAQSDEQFKAVMNTEHDSRQLMAHLNAQDAELLKQTEMLLKILQDRPPASVHLQPGFSLQPGTVTLNGTTTAIYPVTATQTTAYTTTTTAPAAPVAPADFEQAVHDVQQKDYRRARTLRSATTKPKQPPTPQQARSDPDDPSPQDS